MVPLGTHGQFWVYFCSSEVTLTEYTKIIEVILVGTQNYTASNFFVEIRIVIFNIGVSSVKSISVMSTWTWFIKLKSADIIWQRVDPCWHQIMSVYTK